MNGDLSLLRQISLQPTATIKEAIERLIKTEHKIVLIVDEENRLCGTVTDYDIRQAILKNLPLESPVSQIMSADPITISDRTSKYKVDKFMRERGIDYLPVIDDERHVVDIRFLRDLIRHERQSPQIAVVMAGGFGKRLMPMTQHIPKPMVTVGDRPMLFIILDQLIVEGFNKIYIAVHYKSEIITRAVEAVPRYRDLVEFIHEEEPLGTAGALGMLPEPPKNPFLIINADILTQVPLLQMMQLHSRDRNLMTIATKAERHEIPFGVVDADGSRVVALREKPCLEYRVSIGTYVANPDILQWVPGNERLDMPDLIVRLIEAGKLVGIFPVHEYWLDVGTPEQHNRAHEYIMAGGN